MDPKRAELVEAVFEAAMRWSSPASCQKESAALHKAVADLRAHDAAKVEPTSDPSTPTGWHTVTGADVRRVLDALPVGTEIRVDADFPGEPFHNQEALVYQSAGGGRYAEWRHGALYQASIALTSLTFPRAALPADVLAEIETKSPVPLDPPPGLKGSDTSGETSSLASRVAEVERLLDCVTRHLDPHATSAAAKWPAPTEHVGADARSLPYGCVAYEYPKGNWAIRTSDGEYWWCSHANEWSLDQTDCGWADTREEALYDFHATNKGVPPPGDAKGRYEVVDAGGSQWIVRDKRTGYMYVAHSHGWTNADHYSTFRVADIAEAVRDALERRP